MSLFERILPNVPFLQPLKTSENQIIEIKHWHEMCEGHATEKLFQFFFSFSVIQTRYQTAQTLSRLPSQKSLFSKNPSINQNYQGGHSSWNFRKSWKSHLILFGQDKVMENSLFMKKPWKVMELFSHVQFFFSGVFYI